MFPLNDNFDTFLDLCQHRVWIASELGFANVEQSHIYDDTSLGKSVRLNLWAPYGVLPRNAGKW